MDPTLLKVHLVSELSGDQVVVREQPNPPIREDLLALFESKELAKYLTAEELAGAGRGEGDA